MLGLAFGFQLVWFSVSMGNPAFESGVGLWSQQPSEWVQIVLSIALMCTTNRRIPASASTNQGPKQGALNPPLWRVVRQGAHAAPSSIIKPGAHSQYSSVS